MNPGGTILIFKTNASNKLQIETLRSVFDNKNSVIEWSIDMEDVDRVLRIVCTDGSAEDYIREIRQKGLDCEELP